MLELELHKLKEESKNRKDEITQKIKEFRTKLNQFKGTLGEVYIGIKTNTIQSVNNPNNTLGDEFNGTVDWIETKLHTLEINMLTNENELVRKLCNDLLDQDSKNKAIDAYNKAYNAKMNGGK